MRLFKLSFLFAIALLLLSGCHKYHSGNVFMRKNPIRDCEGKVPVDGKHSKVEIGKAIDASKNISLLTPIVVFKARQRTDLDSTYISKTIEIIEDSVEARFIKDEWVDRVIPRDYDLDGIDADSITSMMLTYKKDTLDYTGWTASKSFYEAGDTDYSLLLVLDGIIGFDGAPVRDRYFWKPDEIGKFRLSELTGNHLMFFVIENKTGKISFADHYVFHCDIRNNDSLQKVLEYAYLKLLEVRFQQI